MPTTQEKHLEWTVEEWVDKYPDLISAPFIRDDIKTFVDIGANVGGIVYSLSQLGLLNNLEKVISFEPDEENFNFLEKTINNLEEYKNGKTEFINIQEGIYYGLDEAKVLGVGDGNVGGYTIGNDERTESLKEYENKTFQLTTLEKHINTFTPDFVKIDIEGAEKNVLLNSSLLHKVKWLLIEWHYEKIDVGDFMKANYPNHKWINSYYENHLFKLT